MVKSSSVTLPTSKENVFLPLSPTIIRSTLAAWLYYAFSATPFSLPAIISVVITPDNQSSL
jgi:hypothetical protein